MSKAIAILFWIIAAPVLCCGIVYVVGETVEHFTQPTPDQLYGCTIKQQAPNGDCP